ncbi:DUF1232 domain-containing protein [Scytonema sp. UIC 10036]|uniref:DUF1232 domain-containing protein n=1 Tax=Scytonema sp. UIC 10036 TaxID=2304196 RepID=UPI0012DAA5B7|nr:DUF1232 domain-containing protein [Scytonema sp. UIC 10036]MUG95472.1 DUF1232 domain-containing protein [Scytonema sp. UIC 10036]
MTGNIPPQEIQKQTASNFYIIESQPEFPANLLKFKEYNVIKAIAIFILLFTFLYTLLGFIGFVQRHYDLGPIQLREWYSPIRAFFGAFSSIFSNLLNIISLIFILVPLILAWLLAWVVFDPREVSNVVLGMTNIIFGVMGIINPVDLIPDFVPVIGTADDVFSGGLMALGALLLTLGAKRKGDINTIIKLMKEGKIDETEGLNKLLEDKGILVKKFTDK